MKGASYRLSDLARTLRCDKISGGLLKTNFKPPIAQPSFDFLEATPRQFLAEAAILHSLDTAVLTPHLV